LYKGDVIINLTGLWLWCCMQRTDDSSYHCILSKWLTSKSVVVCKEQNIALIVHFLTTIPSWVLMGGPKHWRDDTNFLGSPIFFSS